MSPAWIRARKHPPSTKHPRGHTTYQVLYRRGGRAYTTETAGSFTGKRDAELRRDLIGGWLAQGLDPRAELAKLQNPPEPVRLDRSFTAMASTRHDVGDARQYHYERGRDLAVEFFTATRDPHTITVVEVREYVGFLVAKRYAAATISSYFGPLAQLLDHLDVQPNPARHPSVKLPQVRREEPIVMTLAQFRTILEGVKARHRLPLRILEATGMRPGELVKLQWGDVDTYESRLRISVTRTKSRAGQRWAQVPQPLMDELELLVAREDRTAERRVFADLTVAALYWAMSRACMHAGIPTFSARDLRHRRASLWHAQGVPDKVVQERIGHEKLSTTHDVYTHVVVDPRDDEWA